MMNNEMFPKVSVVVPVWNPGLGIRKCVDSLRRQTLTDIEMIFVDDCGTDGAMDIVRAAAAEDPRIRIITNPENVGPGPSRNDGIEAARGEYLSFVDSDDYVDAFFLERLYAKAVAGQLDIVKGRVCYVKEDGSQAEYAELNNRIHDGLQSGKPLFGLFSYQHQSALFRRAFVLGNGIYYGTSRRAQDTTFLLKACHRAGRFDLEDTAEYCFYERNDSLMHDHNPHTLERMFHGFREQMDYIVDNMVDEANASQYVAQVVHYNLMLCNFLRRKQACRESCDGFITNIREQVLRFPQLEKLKSVSFVVRVLCDDGFALSYRPFKLPWEKHKVESYVEAIQEWVDFVKGHPECLNAAEKRLFRLFREAGALCQKESSSQSRKMRRRISAQAARLPFRYQKKIFETILYLPRPFSYRVKVALNKYGKPSLPKSLYHAMKRWLENLRHRRAEAELRKKQPIIRQGAPECFEGLPLRIDWHVTTHCNYRCSYCFDAGKEYKKIFCTLEQAETAIKYLASANRPSYQVNLIGGEPTTHPHLADIITLLCQYLGDRLEQLVITTNGSFSESQMKAVLRASEQVNMKLLISIHLEYMNVERVVEWVKRYSSRTNLQLSLMFHPELVEKAMAMADALCNLRRDYPFIMSPSMLREPPKYDRLDSRYTQKHFNCAKEIKERFEKMSAEGPTCAINQQTNFGWSFFVERNVNHSIESHERISQRELRGLTGSVFTGMTCCAGTSIVNIGVDGRTQGMICRLDRRSCNIFEENPFLREDWMHGVSCTQAMCGCSVNYRIPKFRSPAEAQKFIEKKRQEQKKLMSEYQKT